MEKVYSQKLILTNKPDFEEIDLEKAHKQIPVIVT